MEPETVVFKWEGKQAAQVNGVTAEQAWLVVSDFCNVHEWFPTVDTCSRVEGTDGQTGLVRYCASTATKEDEETKWAKERLVEFDPIGRCLSYEVLENNVGFRSYVATVKVMQVDGADESDSGKVCRIEWSFVSDPVDGWKKEDLESYWEGKQAAQVNGVTAEQAWLVVSDFCNVHEWFPTVDTCSRVEGTDGQTGLVRYCASTATKEDEETKWAKERLVEFDPIGRCLSYEVLENNVGFRSYVATVKVMQVDGADESDSGKVCRIEWSFVSDPVDGWKKEDLESYVGFCLKHMANKMEMNL
ncbi:hypothetical protein DY000_02036738 [Brassica cretica]|uniref:Bet v I/Major latex protein domain-containing protein n=1 Tax=Brassica cretica TaxID=69181 RepID=A0ABQ7BET0_BRACR|nr:hypothetical protein DY000_02036738 [Brassica cretica]